MAKKPPLLITIRPTREILEDFARTLHAARKGLPVEPRRELSFESIDTLRKVLTKGRLELLSAIKRQNPKSIYDLAKIVKRDLKSVNTDLEALKDIDIVEFRKEKEGRARTIPTLVFDHLNISVEI
jgi:predicted transcriptional regulator